MNLILWTLIIMVSLCIKLTVQVGSTSGAGIVDETQNSGGGSISGVKKTCKEWILSEDYADGKGHFEENQSKAKKRDKNLDDLKNVWATAFAKALIERTAIFEPFDICFIFKQFGDDTNAMPLITPSIIMTCVELINLSGFRDDHAKHPMVNNLQLAKLQKERKVHEYLSTCAVDYIKYILDSGDVDTRPTSVCSHFLGVDYHKQIGFKESCNQLYV